MLADSRFSKEVSYFHLCFEALPGIAPTVIKAEA